MRQLVLDKLSPYRMPQRVSPCVKQWLVYVQYMGILIISILPPTSRCLYFLYIFPFTFTHLFLLIALSPTSYHNQPPPPPFLLHLFTEAGNEPHLAVIGFHGILLFLFLQGWSMRKRFSTAWCAFNQQLNRKNIFSNILQFSTLFAGNIACNSLLLCCHLI